MTDFWERMATRSLPTSTVPLPVEGGTVEVVFRALLPAEWEALVAEFPSTGADAEPGTIDVRAMRSALLAASVVAPDGSPPKDPAWWDQMIKGGALVHGELDRLFETCWDLNQMPMAGPDLGKD